MRPPKHPHLRTVLLAIMCASIVTLLWPPEHLPFAFLKPLHQLEWLGYDTLFAVRGQWRSRIDPRIVVIGYDENTEKSLQQAWPPPRRLHARLIDHVFADGAKVIVFDVLFSGATTADDDRAFDAALARAGNVVLACHLGRDLSQKMVTLDSPYYDTDSEVDFERAARTGFATVGMDAAIDSDRIVRRLTPVMTFQDEWIPSLSGSALLHLTGTTDAEIQVTDSAVRFGAVRIPRTGPDAFDVIYPARPIPSAYLNFSGGAAAFPLVRYEQVIAGAFAPGAFRDKVVLIGVTGSDLARRTNELFTTSYTHLNPEASGAQVTTKLPGVVLHAQFLNAMLTGGFIAMPPIWALWPAVFAFAVAGIATTRRYMNWRGPAALAGIVALYLAVVYGLFVFAQVYLPWIIPVTLVAATAGIVAWVERAKLRQKWGGYLSPAVLEYILQHDIGMTAQRRQASVVFGDIRGFTAFSEAQAPETVVRLLNRHLERLTQIVYQANGTIDKFLGDGILVVFGAPVTLADDAVRAVRSAWLMRETSLQAIYDDDGTPYTLGSGFGVTTGPLVAGHVGGRQRHEFTIIGDTVNLASRLQGVTGQPDVIIDHPTYTRVRAHVEVEPLGPVSLKGKEQPVTCFRVVQWSDMPRVDQARTESSQPPSHEIATASVTQGENHPCPK